MHSIQRDRTRGRKRASRGYVSSGAVPPFLPVSCHAQRSGPERAPTLTWPGKQLLPDWWRPSECRGPLVTPRRAFLLPPSPPASQRLSWSFPSSSAQVSSSLLGRALGGVQGARPSGQRGGCSWCPFAGRKQGAQPCLWNRMGEQS